MKAKKEFGGKSEGFILASLINNPFVNLSDGRYELVKISSFREDFEIVKMGDSYRFDSRFSVTANDVASYRAAFKNFISVAKGNINTLYAKIKNEKTGKEALIEIDFEWYVFTSKINRLRNRCAENECHILADLPFDLMISLSSAMISSKNLKHAETAFVKMNAFTGNRYVSNVYFWGEKICFEFENKDYEINYLTQEIKEV